MILIGILLICFLYALNDYFIIRGYEDIQYKKYWHYTKFFIVAISFYLIVGLSWDLLAYYIIYYIIY